ncbi:TetR/AcrR family transcriptional regulator [Paracoccus sp. p4-l81]|uniref:TetR/AcrR family transcriptional regulator n=1 Tax=unclassified Paracoccus (in: a-proteobacteria) TaxID=2688777 RepID=UPI0035B7C0E4
MTGPTPICPDQPADGRRQRSGATRQKVGQALFDLVRQTGQLPDAATVAARAGVARRTVFRYFSDSAALEVETARMMARMLHDEFPQPVPRGSLAERLTAFLDHRLRVYAAGDPVRGLIEAARLRGATGLDDFIAEMMAMMRAQLLGMIPELARPGTPVEALTSFEVVTGWDHFSALRRHCGMDAAQIAAQFDWTARAVLVRARIGNL